MACAPGHLCVFIMLMGVSLPRVQAEALDPGGETTFALTADGADSDTAADSTSVQVMVQTAEWGSEVTWNIDGKVPTPSRRQPEGSSSPLLESSARPHLADLCAVARDAIAKGYLAIVDRAVYQQCGLADLCAVARDAIARGYLAIVDRTVYRQCGLGAMQDAARTTAGAHPPPIGDEDHDVPVARDGDAAIGRTNGTDVVLDAQLTASETTLPSATRTVPATSRTIASVGNFTLPKGAARIVVGTHLAPALNRSNSINNDNNASNPVVKTSAHRGLQTAAASSTNGAVFSFGRGIDGRLGHGDTATQLAPAQIYSLGTGNAMVSAGEYHSLVLTTSGTVFSFGLGSYGRLGHGDGADQLAPAQIQSLGIGNAMVSAGDAHSLVLTTSGTVFSFGL
eukprot:SAG11_NODE_6490_length_1298_cov_2.156977_1_plen_395_part_01